METLAREFGPGLKMYFRRRLPLQADIDDLVQEVFLKLIRRGDVDDIENLKGYLLSAASNILKDRTKEQIATRADYHQPVDENFAEESAFSPERVLLAKEELQDVLRSLGQLSETTQAAFMLCELHGHSHDDAGELLGMSARNVRKHLKKAHEHLFARKRGDW